MTFRSLASTALVAGALALAGCLRSEGSPGGSSGSTGGAATGSGTTTGGTANSTSGSSGSSADGGGGDGGSDAGCSLGSTCPSGDYCDFGTAPCALVAASIPLPGSCRANCEPSGCGLCHQDGDCGPTEFCDTATASCRPVSCPVPVSSCPPGCPFTPVPHGCGSCLCADGCPTADAGTTPPCSASSCSAGELCCGSSCCAPGEICCDYQGGGPKPLNPWMCTPADAGCPVPCPMCP